MDKKFCKEIEILKKAEILEMKYSISQTKNAVESLNSRLGEVEERISYLGDRSFKISKSYEKKEKLERPKAMFAIYEIPSDDQIYKSLKSCLRNTIKVIFIE